MKNVTITVTEIKALDGDGIRILNADGKLTQKECKQICKNENVCYIVHAISKVTYEVDELAYNSFVIANGKKVQ